MRTALPYIALFVGAMLGVLSVVLNLPDQSLAASHVIVLVSGVLIIRMALADIARSDAKRRADIAKRYAASTPAANAVASPCLRVNLSDIHGRPSSGEVPPRAGESPAG